jgi:hypothetical protein
MPDPEEQAGPQDVLSEDVEQVLTPEQKKKIEEERSERALQVLKDPTKEFKQKIPGIFKSQKPVYFQAEPGDVLLQVRGTLQATYDLQQYAMMLGNGLKSVAIRVLATFVGPQLAEKAIGSPTTKKGKVKIPSAFSSFDKAIAKVLLSGEKFENLDPKSQELAQMIAQTSSLQQYSKERIVEGFQSGEFNRIIFIPELNGAITRTGQVIAQAMRILEVEQVPGSEWWAERVKVWQTVIEDTNERIAKGQLVGERLEHFVKLVDDIQKRLLPSAEKLAQTRKTFVTIIPGINEWVTGTEKHVAEVSTAVSGKILLGAQELAAINEYLQSMSAYLAEEEMLINAIIRTEQEKDQLDGILKQLSSNWQWLATDIEKSVKQLQSVSKEG